MYKKINLYHYSNAEIKSTLSPKFYGTGYYTCNDTRATSVKRTFYYLEPKPLESFFYSARYLYTVTAQSARIYDLRSDLRGYIKENQSITELLQAIKQKYNGVIYRAGGIDIVNLFYPAKIKDKRAQKC
jgi:hypothetical protein